MHREYWAYQKRLLEKSEYPWAIVVEKDYTARKPDTVWLSATIYLETIESPTHSVALDIGHKNRVDDYVAEIVNALVDLSNVTSADIAQITQLVEDAIS